MAHFETKFQHDRSPYRLTRSSARLGDAKRKNLQKETMYVKHEHAYMRSTPEFTAGDTRIDRIDMI